jgi:hypothetical protein
MHSTSQLPGRRSFGERLRASAQRLLHIITHPKFTIHKHTNSHKACSASQSHIVYPEPTTTTTTITTTASSNSVSSSSTDPIRARLAAYHTQVMLHHLNLVDRAGLGYTPQS